MKKLLGSFLIMLLLGTLAANAQRDSLINQDSMDNVMLEAYESKIAAIEKQRLEDSLMRAALEKQLNSLKTTDNLKKEELKAQLDEIASRESKRLTLKMSQIDSLRKNTKGYPVLGVMGDTLFHIYTKIGASRPEERAENISKKIKELYDDDFLVVDSIYVVSEDNLADVIYDETIIMSVSEMDALWNDTTIRSLADSYALEIKASIVQARKDNSFVTILIRIGLVVLSIFGIWLLIWLVGKGHRRLLKFIAGRKDDWLKDLSYKDYTFLSAYQEFKFIIFISRFLKWVIYAFVLYIGMPLVLSIFPFTRGYSIKLFGLIWSPFKSIIFDIWNYLPALFNILVIILVMNYVIRFVKYIFSEIENEKLNITGFHTDWARPTFNIVRFLLYAFTFVLIFPLLPGSDSDIFKGVSVFIGILFSLGSSSAIANMIAGLVITYMRPFKIGDRIKIGDTSGDVVEKTLLVTRIKTIKNEEVTIPNSAILSGNTINYTSYSQNEGLIIHTSVTIGYDVPWQLMYEALIEAALRTDLIMKDPKPFVLQTSLDDFYVAYQLNAYTKEASKQALIYSNLHQNIQDVCNEKGVEILSPHYRAQRDGNSTTIPSDYLPKDYQAPPFNVNIKKDKPE
ncbi:mechanosensitive ion channel domain-containing protein [Echinicola shivajiensis]|uniref:mechanosensitive ion channel domain-containing protein n=1 Tax=Echinicola shivajiensis TaxID=1035916 RepID=UPI001FE8C64C|nr:mechanosensitive ion channel domain-containing protein [Echinicola shivajiensis]